MYNTVAVALRACNGRSALSSGLRCAICIMSWYNGMNREEGLHRQQEDGTVGTGRRCLRQPVPPTPPTPRLNAQRTPVQDGATSPTLVDSPKLPAPEARLSARSFPRRPPQSSRAFCHPGRCPRRRRRRRAPRARPGQRRPGPSLPWRRPSAAPAAS